MEPHLVHSLLATMVWLAFGLADADQDTEKNILKALPGLSDSDRYAGGFRDSYVSDAWERAEDGWVRGGYKLVSGDASTDVRYAMDPFGELRVETQAPGQPAVVRKFRAGSPLVGGYRPPFYDRLSAGKDPFDFDDPLDDDFFGNADDWDAASPPAEVDDLLGRWDALRARRRSGSFGAGAVLPRLPASAAASAAAPAFGATSKTGSGSGFGSGAFNLNFAAHRVNA